MIDMIKQNMFAVSAFVAVIIILIFIVIFADTASDVTEDVLIEEGLQPESMEITDLDHMNNVNPIVTLRTSTGDISLEMFMDVAPITAGNFIKLAKEGFYNGTKFHRVINNFMIQGGDPNTKGDDVETYGRGGPEYTIEDEFVTGLSNLRGTISMANIGQPNSGGSQFFINYADNVGLDFDKEPTTSRHPVFGQVVGGMDIVDAIIAVETDGRDMPLTPIVVEEAVVTEGEAMMEEDDNQTHDNMTEGEPAMMEDHSMDEAMEMETEGGDTMTEGELMDEETPKGDGPQVQ
jgi:peptidylprolyl isomerase